MARPERFGAVGGDRTDDTDGLQRAIDSGGVVLLSNVYRTTRPLVVPSGTTIVGTGTQSAGIVNRSSDLFHWGARDASVRHLSLRSFLGGGHVFNQTGPVTHNTFVDLNIRQDNDAASIYSHTTDAGNHLFNSWQDIKARHTTSATVATFDFHVSDAAGAANHNQWQRVEMLLSGAYSFRFESARINNYVYGMTLRDVAFEVPAGGCVLMLGANACVVDNCAVYDLNVLSARRDLFRIGAGTHGTNPQPSRHVRINGLSFNGQNSQLDDGVALLRIDASGADRTVVQSIHQNATGLPPVDYGDTRVTEIACLVDAVGAARRNV